MPKEVSNWDLYLEYCAEKYNLYFDLVEEMFICPYCGEPLYREEELSDQCICPICGEEF